MKSSTKVLGFALLLILFVLCVGIVGSRIYLNRMIGKEYKNEGSMILGEPETISYNRKDFNSLDITGTWEIHIQKGSEYAVEITGPANILDKIEVSQSGKELKIKNPSHRSLFNDSFKIDLTLPDLESLSIAGGVDLIFNGFNGKSLRIDLSGAGRIQGLDSRYEYLVLNCSGAGQLDMSDCLSVNADVNLSGAGEVLLNMDGGLLDGSISGLGSVEYTGQFSRNQMKVTGLGNVSRR